jgi:hypothetical protein
VRVVAGWSSFPCRAAPPESSPGRQPDRQHIPRDDRSRTAVVLMERAQDDLLGAQTWSESVHSGAIWCAFGRGRGWPGPV